MGVVPGATVPINLMGREKHCLRVLGFAFSSPLPRVSSFTASIHVMPEKSICIYGINATKCFSFEDLNQTDATKATLPFPRLLGRSLGASPPTHRASYQT